MKQIIIFLIIATILYALYKWYKKLVIIKRENVIDKYPFPSSISLKIQEKYSFLTDDQVSLVIKGLREYFHVCNISGKTSVAMPSQVVDVAWHELILHTKLYELFCAKALGRFLHHTPAEAMKSPTDAQKGIKKAWRLSCLREDIDPDAPKKLPILFALDRELNIPDGFSFTLYCSKSDKDSYCAGHIGCSSCSSGDRPSGPGGSGSGFGPSDVGCSSSI